MKIRKGILVMLCMLMLAGIAVKLSAMYYCPEGLCRGMCGCEGEVQPINICAFQCVYNEWITIKCHEPSRPGGADGCQMWEEI